MSQYSKYPPNSGGGSSGVSSVNSITGAVTIAPGTGITVTTFGSTITIAATGGGGGGTVTSIGLSAPGIFSVTGSPVTTSGTLALALTNQNANLVWAGPATGSPAAPTFRSLVSADIPSLAYVSSVGLTLPGIFSVTGSPITTSGTLAATLVTQSANLFFAGPGSGAAAAPTFRSIATADLPSGVGTPQSGAFTAVVGKTYVLSGSNYAIALPDATAATSTQPITFIVVSNPVALSGPITFTFISAQTCDGFSTYGLYTKYERITIVSDGTNWQVLNHATQTPYMNDVNVLPTAAAWGSVTNLNTYYKRRGAEIEIYFQFTAGTVTSTGMSITLFTYAQIDTAQVQAVGVLLMGQATGLHSAGLIYVGNVEVLPFYDGANTDATKIWWAQNLSNSAPSNFTKIATNAVAVTSQLWQGRVTYPVAGWRP